MGEDDRELRRFAMRELHQHDMESRAPETVEIVAWRDREKSQAILHVLNRTGAGLPQGQGQLMHASIPFYDITITLADELAPKGHAWVEPGRKVVPLTRAEQNTRIQLPPVDVWMTVVVE